MYDRGKKKEGFTIRKKDDLSLEYIELDRVLNHGLEMFRFKSECNGKGSGERYILWVYLQVWLFYIAATTANS